MKTKPSESCKPPLKSIIIMDDRIVANKEVEKNLMTENLKALEDGVGSERGLLTKISTIGKNLNGRKFENGCRFIIDGHGDVNRASKGSYTNYSKQPLIDNIGEQLKTMGKTNASPKPMICSITCHGGAAKPPKDIQGIDTLSVGSKKYPIDGPTGSSIVLKLARNSDKSNFEMVADLAISSAETLTINGAKITGPKPDQKQQDKHTETYSKMDDKGLKEHLSDKLKNLHLKWRYERFA